MSVSEIILLIILLIILFFIAVMVVDCHRLVIRNYDYQDGRVGKDTKIVLLSDLHSKTFGKGNERLIKKINDIAPDLICVSGDMYTSMKSDKGEVAKSLIKELSKKYRIIYSNGNHEQKTKLMPEEFPGTYEGYESFLKECGVTHLQNESYEDSESNLKFYGLELPFKYYRKFKRYEPPKEELCSLIGDIDDKKVNILIAHNPQYFESYVLWGADLTFSGHVHGGLMRFPLGLGAISPNFTLFPQYSGGKYMIGKHMMVLSCGLGTHHLPIRIFNPGEISLINITKTRVI